MTAITPIRLTFVWQYRANTGLLSDTWIDGCAFSNAMEARAHPPTNLHPVTWRLVRREIVDVVISGPADDDGQAGGQ